MSTLTHHTSGRVAANHPAMSFVNALRDMFAVSRQRQALGALPEHLLRDIGITPKAAHAEARRAPWDVPAHPRS